MSTLILVDFDGVLLDDEAFKKDYLGVFGAYGVSEAVERTAYERAKSKSGGVYDSERHLTELSQDIPNLDIPVMRRDLVAVAYRASEFLFPDAIPFLETMQKRGYILVLVSAGAGLQEVKIAACGLNQFFTCVDVTPNPAKVAPVREFLHRFKPGTAFMIDDKSFVVDAVKRALPDVVAVQVLRHPGMRESELADACMSDLRSVQEFIFKRMNP